MRQFRRAHADLASPRGQGGSSGVPSMNRFGRLCLYDFAWFFVLAFQRQIGDG
jgi:hypothetical protein